MYQQKILKRFCLLFFCFFGIGLQGMQRLGHRAAHNTRSHKRTYYGVYKKPLVCNTKDVPALAELQQMLKVPDFSLEMARSFITMRLPYISKEEGVYANHCAMNGIVQCVVNEAVQHKKTEEKYASVLKLLDKQGWSADIACCKTDMLHTAVKHDLPHVVEVLADTAGCDLFEEDAQGRWPYHHVKSPQVFEYLGRKFPRMHVNAQDNDGNTPLHLAPACVVQCLLGWGADPHILNKKPFSGLLNETPLRKAVAEADVEKCEELLHSPKITLSNVEYWLLCSYTREAIRASTVEKRYKAPCSNDCGTSRRLSYISILSALEKGTQ